MSTDNSTSTGEWIVIALLLITGVIFLAKPATATIGAFVDFADAFPSPNTLGPNGTIVALVALLFGTGGLVRNKIR